MTHEKTAIVYLRSSTRAQVNSIERQRSVCREYAASHGIRILEEFQDHGKSGSLPVTRRKGLESALDAMLKTGATVLLLESVDRLARDYDLAQNIRTLVGGNGAEIIGVMETDASPAFARFAKTIAEAFAEYERRVAIENGLEPPAHPSAPPFDLRDIRLVS